MLPNRDNEYRVYVTLKVGYEGIRRLSGFTIRARLTKWGEKFISAYVGVGGEVVRAYGGSDDGGRVVLSVPQSMILYVGIGIAATPHIEAFTHEGIDEPGLELLSPSAASSLADCALSTVQAAIKTQVLAAEKVWGFDSKGILTVTGYGIRRHHLDEWMADRKTKGATHVARA